MRGGGAVEVEVTQIPQVATEVATQRGVTSQISGVAKSEDAKMAKSEDAPTREVTAAAKGGEVATCKNLEKNDLFMSRLESKMQK